MLKNATTLINISKYEDIARVGTSGSRAPEKARAMAGTSS
jgi:hypothetical protein